MKKSTMGMFSKIVVFLLFAVFFSPMMGLFLYLAVFDPSLPQDDRLLFAAGAVLFGGLVVFAAYRVLYRGIGWVEYDKDAVIFHYSRREQYRFFGKIFLETVFRLALGRADICLSSWQTASSRKWVSIGPLPASKIRKFRR